MLSWENLDSVVVGDLVSGQRCHYTYVSFQVTLMHDHLVSPSVTELCEYAANVDIPIARESIRAVGKIALQQYDVNAIVDRLLQFLEMEKDYVTAEALVHY